MNLRAAMVCASLALAACAGHASRTHGTGAPEAFELRLSPRSLGHELALQQQLRIVSATGQRTLDALLEVDAREVRLEIRTLGQSALRLRWDGEHLQQQRSPWLPATVRGGQILGDLQLANWPVADIRAALPAGWSLVETGGQRELRRGDAIVVTVRYPGNGRIEIERSDIRLTIDSVPIGSVPQ